MNDVKVVYTGKDLVDDTRFNIVKIGVYTPTPEGAIAALKDGIFDKFGEESPEFDCAYFKNVSTIVLDGKEYTTCVFLFEEYTKEYPNIRTFISGKVVYTKRMNVQVNKAVDISDCTDDVINGNDVNYIPKHARPKNNKTRNPYTRKRILT